MTKTAFSIAALYTNVAVTIILIPIGLWFFKEHLSSTNIVGLVLAFAGLVLMGTK